MTDSPHLAEVVTLYEANAAKYPVETLRTIAGEIEAGTHGDVRSLTVVLEKADGAVEVFGIGDQGLLRALGLLHLGMAKLTTMRLTA